MKKNRTPSPADVRIPLTICIIVGILMLLGYTLLSALTDFSELLIGIVLTVLYAYVAVFCFVLVRGKLNKIKIEIRRAEAFNKDVSRMFGDTVDLPYAITDENGALMSVNNAHVGSPENNALYSGVRANLTRRNFIMKWSMYSCACSSVMIPLSRSR